MSQGDRYIARDLSRPASFVFVNFILNWGIIIDTADADHRRVRVMESELGF